jgi:hypothetical protein
MLLTKKIIFKFLLALTSYTGQSAITKFENDFLYESQEDCEKAGREKTKNVHNLSYKCYKVNQEFYEGGNTN